MVNKKFVLILGMILLAGSLTAAGVVFFGGNEYEDSNDGLVLDIQLAADNYDSETKTFTDDSGQGNDGVSANAAVFTSDNYGKSENAMSFDGSSDSVNTSYGSGINTSTSPHTFSMWVKANNPSSNLMFLSAGQVPDANARLYLATYNSNWNMGIYNDMWGDGTTEVTTDWTHIVLTMNGSVAKLYINGEYDHEKIYSSYVFNEDIILGKHGSASSYYWNGLISNIKIYNQALSSEEVSALYNSSKPKASGSSLEKGLVGHWMLDSEGYNSATERITDKTPYSNHGTNYGAELTTDRRGHSNKAMLFDSNDYINCGDNVIDLGETTVTLWFKSEDKTTHNGIIDFAGSAGLGHFDFNHAYDRPLLYFAGANYRYFDTSFQNYLDGKWHFLVLYIKGAQIDDILEATLSVDLVNSQPWSTSHSESPTSWNDLHIGKTSYGSFNGSISDVRVYNRALSEAEIETLYYSYRPKAASGSLYKGLILDMPLTSSYMKNSTFLTDRTPYSNDGQNYGATVGENSTSFDGSGYIDIPYNEFNLDYFTISFWTKTSSASQTIFNTYWGTPRVAMGIYSGGTAYFNVRGWNGTVTQNLYVPSTTSISDSNYYLITGVKDNDTIRMYVNGISEGNTTGAENVNPNSGRDTLGLGANGPYHEAYSPSYVGEISDFKIYNRALSEDEIKLLYYKGR